MAHHRSTRHDCLKWFSRAAPAGLAAPWILPAGTLRAAEGDSENDRPVFGCIGCGDMAFRYPWPEITDLVNADNIAIRLGREKIIWDPKTEQIVGDDEANAFLSRPQREGYLISPLAVRHRLDRNRPYLHHQRSNRRGIPAEHFTTRRCRSGVAHYIRIASPQARTLSLR
jgi:hypothetical protein